MINKLDVLYGARELDLIAKQYLLEENVSNCILKFM